MLKNQHMTILEAVELMLEVSDTALHIHQIAERVKCTEVEAATAVRTLSGRGQIDVIPTRGRYGNRYAAVRSAKPVAAASVPVQADEQPQEAVSTTEVATEVDDEAQMAHPASGPAPEELPRFLLTVPKRKPRIVRGAERAREAAMAAVRQGASHARVFELVPQGAARRGSEWTDTVP